MKEKHIILRSSRATTRDLFLGAGFLRSQEAESVITGLAVEVDEIKRSSIADLARHSDIVAIAPAMPMKLIQPVAIEDIPDAANLDIAWGVKAVGADTSPFSGAGVVVAVLDTGIDASHPAFAGISIIEKDFSGEGSGDQNGHGTHCAGTIFGRNTGDRRIGVATGVEKALIGKVLGNQGGSSNSIISAMLWAVENGANVISMSLGIDFPGYVEYLIQNGLPPALATSRALEGYRSNLQLFEQMAALIQAQASFLQPCIIVAAAGNESRRDENPDFEIAVSPPAVSNGIISVAALGQGEAGLVVAPFSNTGATVAGPGVGTISARPGGGFVMMSGTSMATPHVAGVAALWAEKIMNAGSLSPIHLTARLIGSGISSSLQDGFDPFDIGAGLVQAPQA